MADHGSTASQKFPATTHAWKTNTSANVTGYSYGSVAASMKVANAFQGKPKIKIWNGSAWVLAPSA